MGGDNVLGVVIAVVGVIGSVLVARVSTPRPQPALTPLAEVDDGAPALGVGPAPSRSPLN